MGLWNKIKSFFSGKKSEENSGINTLGALEATVEAVSASEDDLTVELFEMTEDSEFSPEEDPDIEVEIVDSEADDLSVLSELEPADRVSGLEPCRENEEVCVGNMAECPSRMTEEYKQWLREQEALRDQTDHTKES